MKHLENKNKTEKNDETKKNIPKEIPIVWVNI